MSERNLYEVTGDIKDINTLLVPREQLEAMEGEQEPVQIDHIACIDGGELRYMTGRKAPAYDCELYAMPNGKRAAKLYAAPVAQQPQREDYKAWYDEAMCASNEAGFVGASAADTIRELARELAALKQPQAERKERLEAALSTVFGWKQPQAEAAEVFYCKTCGCAMQMPHDDCLACERGEPRQAEAVPKVQIVNCDTCKHAKNDFDDYPCNRCGFEFGDGPFNRWEAPQQAETVPSDVVRDAERWRTFLATRPTNTHAVINDAIDAAMAKGEKS